MEKYMIGLQLLAVGMGTVIITLYILSLILRLSGYLFSSDKTRRDTSDGIELKESVEAEVTPEEIVVMSSAIYQILHEKEKNYRIISVKKEDNSGWKN